MQINLRQRTSYFPVNSHCLSHPITKQLTDHFSCWNGNPAQTYAIFVIVGGIPQIPLQQIRLC